MRAVVDLSVCQGYANCVVEAGAIFDIDDATGKVIVLIERIPDELAGEARRAVASCPVGAIALEEGACG